MVSWVSTDVTGLPGDVQMFTTTQVYWFLQLALDCKPRLLKWLCMIVGWQEFCKHLCLLMMLERSTKCRKSSVRASSQTMLPVSQVLKVLDGTSCSSLCCRGTIRRVEGTRSFSCLHNLWAMMLQVCHRHVRDGETNTSDAAAPGHGHPAPLSCLCQDLETNFT